MIMKIKIFAVSLFVVIFLTDAVEVTDEDVNSPLVSYLLAKVQRLEAKMIAKPSVRNTREVEKRSVDTNTSADKKTKLRLSTASGYLYQMGKHYLSIWS